MNKEKSNDNTLKQKVQTDDHHEAFDNLSLNEKKILLLLGKASFAKSLQHHLSLEEMSALFKAHGVELSNEEKERVYKVICLSNEKFNSGDDLLSDEDLAIAAGGLNMNVSRNLTPMDWLTLYVSTH